jgi:hypothetical protein
LKEELAEAHGKRNTQGKEIEELKLGLRRNTLLTEARDVEIQALMDKIQTLEKQNKNVFMELDQSLCLNASNVFQTAGRGSPGKEERAEGSPVLVSAIAVAKSGETNKAWGPGNESLEVL